MRSRIRRKIRAMGWTEGTDKNWEDRDRRSSGVRGMTSGVHMQKSLEDATRSGAGIG